jgi:hypothetical protein
MCVRLKPRSKKTLVKPGVRGEDNIKIHLYYNTRVQTAAQDRELLLAVINSVTDIRTPQKEDADQLIDYQLSKKDYSL